MPESHLPLARMHLTATAVSLFAEAQEAPPNPYVEEAAKRVDEALTLLDVATRQPVDVRPPAPEDWQAA